MNIIPRHPLTTDRRDSLVLLLAWAAGSVDAIGYFGLDHVFTANMTGNTVLLGLALGQGHVLDALRNLVALAGFVGGVGIGALVGEGADPATREGDWDRRVTGIVLLETAVMAAFTLTWHLSELPRGPRALQWLIFLAALAMGLQSSGVRRLKLPGVATTYVTGTMTSLFTGLTTRFHETARGGTVFAALRETLRWNHQTRMQASVLILYALSAVLSGLFQLRLPALVAVTPLLALAAVVITVALSKGQPPAPTGEAGD
ncbi:MAG TPA: YoaK family protein [Candidatus Binatia bacterium]|nr:YoaK family protein [Candidatus Binatia bacterium]